MKIKILKISLTLLLFQGYFNAIADFKKVKVNGVIYTIDFSKNTASVGGGFFANPLTKNKNNLMLEAEISYKHKKYPVTSIKPMAFKDYKDIYSISISQSVSSLGSGSLDYLSKLRNFYVDPRNKFYIVKNGVLFNKEMTEIIRFPPGSHEANYTIPDGVVTIGEGAFSGCGSLKKIEIPASVKVIKQEAFYFCHFKRINIPSNVTEIADKVFYYSNLVAISLPMSVSKAGNQIFSHCFDLDSVTYQNKQLVFPPDAFENCPKLFKDKIVFKTPVALYLELAAKGNPDDQYRLAMSYFDGEGFRQDYGAAKEWALKAAEQGHILSKVALGDIFYNGYGVNKDFKEAVKWYSEAAEKGDLPSQKKLGDIYFNGFGGTKDLTIAYNYYLSAAKQNDREAEEAVGLYYYFGKGNITKDYKEAFKWLKLSAEKGNPSAAYYVGVCCYEGLGVEKSRSEALKWMESSVNGGIESGLQVYFILAYEDANNKLNNKNYSSAIAGFSDLLKFDKDNVDAYINRGFCYLSLKVKDYKLAEKDFKRALELEPENAAAKNNLQFIADYNEQMKKADEFCKEGDKYFENRDYINAVSYYAKCLAIDSTRAYPYRAIGNSFVYSNAYLESIKYFDKALKIDPNYTAALKDRRFARSMAVLIIVSQTISTVSSALNNSYSSSVNSSVYQPTVYTPHVSSSPGSMQHEPCSFCRGTGKNPGKEYPAQFGLDPVQKTTKCPICGDWDNHYHKACPSCQGKGYVMKYKSN